MKGQKKDMVDFLTQIRNQLSRGEALPVESHFKCVDAVKESAKCGEIQPDYDPKTTGCIDVYRFCGVSWPLQGDLDQQEHALLEGKYKGMLAMSLRGHQTFRYRDLSRATVAAREKWIGKAQPAIHWRDFVRLNGNWFLVQVEDNNFSGRLDAGDHVLLGWADPKSISCPPDNFDCRVLYHHKKFRLEEGIWWYCQGNRKTTYSLSASEKEIFIRPAEEAFLTSLRKYGLCSEEGKGLGQVSQK